MRLSELTSAGSLLFLVAAAYARRGDDSGSDGDDDDDNNSSTASPTGTSTSTTSSATPSSSPNPFQFIPPSNSTVCTSTMLQWSFDSSSSSSSSSGDDDDLSDTNLTLVITNDRADFPAQSGAAPSGSLPPLVEHTLATVPASARAFAWRAVDVPPGTYVVAANFSSPDAARATSPPFTVLAGNDTSCLDTSAGSGSGALGNGTGTSTAAGTPSANADTSAPPKKLDPGVLGGVVAGAVFIAVLLILVFTFPHYWKACLKRSRSRRPGGPYYLF